MGNSSGKQRKTNFLININIKLLVYGYLRSMEEIGIIKNAGLNKKLHTIT